MAFLGLFKREPKLSPMDDSTLLQARDVTRDRLRRIFEPTGLFDGVDSDGDIKVRDGLGALVIPKAEGKQIRFFVGFRAKPTASMEAKLRFINRLNSTRHQPRACVNQHGHFIFDFVMVTEGGITPTQIVGACRWFLRSLIAIAVVDKEDVVA